MVYGSERAYKGRQKRRFFFSYSRAVGYKEVKILVIISTLD